MYLKKDLIAKVSEKTNSKKNEAEKFVDAYIDSVKELIMDENENGLNIIGFEKYEVKPVKARKCRNPQTGDTFEKEATVRCKSTLSKKIKNLDFNYTTV